MSEQPAFIDPIELAEGHEVDDHPIPLWFKVIVVALVSLAGYYGMQFREGPRDSSHHIFERGRSVVEQVEGGTATVEGDAGH